MQNASSLKVISLFTHKGLKWGEIQPHALILYFILSLFARNVICGKTQDKKILEQGISHTVGMN